VTTLIKTLFLDFDGVLHPTFPVERNRLALASLLVPPVERWQPRIVISSSWRFHFNQAEILARLPPQIARQVQGVTGDAHVGRYARWHEINNYCLRHRIHDWRALDDSAFEFPPGCEELIRCDGARGVTEREVGELVRWLGGWETPLSAQLPSIGART